MDGYKKLAKNTLIFTVSNFASKILVFFLLPLYTRALTPEQFGAAELLMSIATFMIPIFTLGILEGLLRFAVKRAGDLNSLFIYGFAIVLLGSILVCCASPIVMLFESTRKYVWLFCVYTVVCIFESFFGIIIRAMDKLKLMGVTGVLATLVTVGCTGLFIIVFDLGVYGYILTYTVSSLFSVFVYFFGGKIYRLFKYEKLQSSERKLVTKFCLPLVLFRSSWNLSALTNKLILEQTNNISQVGILSAASRIQNIPKTFEGIFSQAWTLSALTENESDEYSRYCTNIYRYFNLLMILVCVGVSIVTPLFANFLFSTEFYEAWKCVPLLLVSVQFSALFGFVQPILAAYNDSKTISIAVFAATVVSIPIVYYLSIQYGAIGVAMSSIVLYAIVWGIAVWKLKKYMPFKIKIVRDIICYVLFTVFASMVMFLNSRLVFCISGVGVLLVIALLNFDLIKGALVFVREFLKKRKADKNAVAEETGEVRENPETVEFEKTANEECAIEEKNRTAAAESENKEADDKENALKTNGDTGEKYK